MIGRLIDEMERFEKHSRPGKTPTYAASQGHDDLMMSSIWALYILKPTLIENYYEVKQFVTDKLGNQYPLFITSYEEVDASTREFITNLDSKFKTSSNQYEISMNQLEQNVQKTQKQLIEHFQLTNDSNISYTPTTNISTNEDDNNFQFRSDLSINKY